MDKPKRYYSGENSQRPGDKKGMRENRQEISQYSSQRDEKNYREIIDQINFTVDVSGHSRHEALLVSDLNRNLTSIKEDIKTSKFLFINDKIDSIKGLQFIWAKIDEEQNKFMEKHKEIEEGKLDKKGKTIMDLNQLKIFGKKGKATADPGKQLKDTEKEYLEYLDNQLINMKSIHKYIFQKKPLTGSDTLGETEKENADYHFADRDNSIFAVLDGVGRNRSYIASESCGKLIHKEILEKIDIHDDAEDIKKKLGAILQHSHQRLNELKERTQKNEGKDYSKMATTVSIAIMRNGKLITADVGDSRILLLRKGKDTLEHLTLDDTVYNWNERTYFEKNNEHLLLIQKTVAESVNFKELSNKLKNSRNSPLMQALGCKSAQIDPRTQIFDIERGDTVVIASDGISDNLRDSEIVECIRNNKWNNTQTAKEVIEKARERSQEKGPRSKPDDMTIVVAMY